MAKFELSINAKRYDVDAPEDMPLLFVLRDLLGMNGTKYGCGKALCGACTVHVDGAPMRSCVTPATALTDTEITTIEGMASDHPVMQAWQDIDVPQCGYCQPGQIMSASALLADNPNPSDDDVDAAMNGNICRCGTYPRIRKAIARAADIAGKQTGR